MDKLGWESLEERRAKTKLGMFYKARMGLVEIPFHLDSMKCARRAGSYAIPTEKKATSTVDSHLFSFFLSTIRLWNSLPADGKSYESLDKFTSFLKHYSTKNSV